MPDTLPEGRRNEWCGARWRESAEWGGNLHLCCYAPPHTGFGHCYADIEKKPCTHKTCDSTEKHGITRCSIVESENEAELSQWAFLPYHNRTRPGTATLQFSGWAFFLNGDGTWHVGDTSGG